jgi:hypothetical protein
MEAFTNAASRGAAHMVQHWLGHAPLSPTVIMRMPKAGAAQLAANVGSG